MTDFQWTVYNYSIIYVCYTIFCILKHVKQVVIFQFEFPNKVYVSKIDIYETYHAGGVKAVKCYDVTGTWITLWSTAQVSVIKHSRIFSPSFTVRERSERDENVYVDISEAAKMAVSDQTLVTLHLLNEMQV